MRQKREPQLNFSHTMPRTEIGRELQAMSIILDENASILDLVLKELTGSTNPLIGRNGMSAEQTLRCAILKQYRELTYEELAFHLEDSAAFRAFARKMQRGVFEFPPVVTFPTQITGRAQRLTGRSEWS